MSIPPSPQIQRDHYLNARQTRLKLSQTWFLIHRNWFQSWSIACSIPPDSIPLQSIAHPEHQNDHVGLDVSAIPPIDNTELIDPSTAQLKPGLSIGIDCEIVPEAFWDLLVDWYGLRDGSRLARQVIAPNGPGSESLELHPPEFHFYFLLPDPSQSQPEPIPSGLPTSPPNQRLSIGITLGALKTHIQTAVFPGLLVRPIRLWVLLQPPSHPSPSTLAITDLPSLNAELVAPPSGDQADLNEALLTSPVNHVAVEHQTPALLWPAHPAPPRPPEPPAFGGQQWLDRMEQINQANMSDPKFPAVVVNGLTEGPEKKNNGILSQISKATPARFLAKAGGLEPKPVRVRGLVGLTNLGNTCFMNSALQCLSNCPELKRYFLSRVYISELNRVNPLGMGGKVAETFGQLVERIWTATSEESSSSIAPREFKAIVGRFNSLFLGYGQQDSQELLTFLLDALHEDLNRVLEKPFDPIPDFEDDGGDEGLVELSEKCWELYRRRNDSVIVDLFQGQYKSTLVCPDCQKVAIKFDEIMYLTLQLPVPPKKLKLSIYFIPLDQSKPRIKVCLEVNNKDCSNVRGLKGHIGKILGKDPNKMAVIEDWSGKPWKIWHDTDTLENVQERDILNVFETPFDYASLRSGVHYGSSDSDELLVPVVSCRGVERGTGTRAHAAFGVFFVVRLGPTERATYGGVYSALAREYARYTSNAADLFEESEDEPMDGRPGAQPVPNLFRIVVPQNPGPLAFPVSNAMSGPTVDLEARLARDAGQTAGQEDAKAVFEPDEPEDLYEGEGVGTSVATGVATAGSKGIQEGDYIECHWTSSAMAHFFGMEKTLPMSRNWVDPPVVEDPEMVAARTRSGSSKKEKGVLTIEECFKDFSKPERLGEEDKWYCPRCKEHVRALKRMQIWKVPDILVVHFKRFSNASGRGGLGGVSGGYGRPSKVDEFVDFPIEGLDLSGEVEGVRVKRELKKKKKMMMMKASQVCSSEGSASGSAMEIENQQESMESVGGEMKNVMESEHQNEHQEEEEESLVYDLFAVDNHFGGLGGGHYTAFAKNEEDGKWHNYDDSHVSEIKSESQIKSSSAYLLFYRRRSLKTLGSKTSVIVNSIMKSSSIRINNGNINNSSGSGSGSNGNSHSSGSGSKIGGGGGGGSEEEEVVAILEEEKVDEEEVEEREEDDDEGSSGKCVSPGSLQDGSVGGSEDGIISCQSFGGVAVGFGGGVGGCRVVDEDYDGMEKQDLAPELLNHHHPLCSEIGSGFNVGVVSGGGMEEDCLAGNGNGVGVGLVGIGHVSHVDNEVEK